MRLSSRILISYGYLATLLIVGAGGATLAFHRLGNNLNSVLGENFRSVQAGIRMLESLERQESAALSLLLGSIGARRQLAAADAGFGEALADARSNITIDAERDIIAVIEDRFDAYREVRDETLTDPGAEQIVSYEIRAVPVFDEVKIAVRQLIDLNHDAMQRADAAAQRAATANAALHALLVALALLSLGPLSASMRRHVLRRLEEVGEVSRAISAGDLGRRVDDRHLDELGLAARQLNQVLDRYQMVEAELAGHRARERALLRCLLANLEQPAVLFSPTGELLESTVDAELSEAVRAAADELVEAMDEPVEATFVVAGRSVQLNPLKLKSGPEVGWLARLDAAQERPESHGSGARLGEQAVNPAPPRSGGSQTPGR